MAPESTCIAVNGKFLSSAGSGVHRVAEELLRALDALLGEDAVLGARFSVELLVPRGPLRTLPLRHIATRRCGLLKRRAWEQFDLPRHAAGQLLLSLCNLGPVASRRAVTMIHDAQVHSAPGSYSRAFRLWYKAIQPVLGRRHRRILTVSEFSRSQLALWGVAPASRTRVVLNGTDHMDRVRADAAAPARAGLVPGRYVLALASTQPHKNIRVLLEAFDGMNDMTGPDEAVDDGLELALFGAASADDFRHAGTVPGPRVKLLGKVSDETLKGLMQGACCLAFPSLTEGFGLPPLEAMRVGCPAVVAPEGALAEVCGDAALYASAHDPAEWRRAFRHLANDARARDGLVARGRRHAASFTWEAAARRLLAILEEVS